MNPPFFRVAAASARVVALLGAPPRIYPWGQQDDEALAYPYVTFQVVVGSPKNYLSGRPDTDRAALQVDIWAASAESARAVAEALRDAIELACHIVAWRGEKKEGTTFRIGFDCDWIVYRT